MHGGIDPSSAVFNTGDSNFSSSATPMDDCITNEEEIVIDASRSSTEPNGTAGVYHEPKAVSGDGPCPICRCDIQHGDETTLSCGHRFCFNCILMWGLISAGKDGNKKGKCPMCRQAFTKLRNIDLARAAPHNLASSQPSASTTGQCSASKDADQCVKQKTSDDITEELKNIKAATLEELDVQVREIVKGHFDVSRKKRDYYANTTILREARYICSKSSGTGAKNRKTHISKPLSCESSRQSSTKKCGCKWSIIYRRSSKQAANLTFCPTAAQNIHEHNHEIGVGTSGKAPRDKEWRRRMSDLTKAENESILLWAAAGCDREQIRELAKFTYGIDYFSPSLMNTLMRIHRVQAGGVTGREMAIALAKLNEMKAGGTFVKYQIDKDDTVNKLFWMYPEQRSLWRKNGRLVVLDATCKTNRFGYPLVIFTLVDSEGVSRMAGQAFLEVEDPASYKWHFTNLREAIGDDAFKGIEVIMTDGHPSYDDPTVLPKHVTHFRCRWHISKNNTKALAWELGWVWMHWNSDYHQWMAAPTKPEFETTYAKLLQKWKNFPKTCQRMKDLYAIKEKWAEPWVKEKFTAGARTTQRGEVINSVIKRYFVGLTTPIAETVTKLHNFVKNQANDGEHKATVSAERKSTQFEMGIMALIREDCSVKATKILASSYDRCHNWIVDEVVPSDEELKLMTEGTEPASKDDTVSTVDSGISWIPIEDGGQCGGFEGRTELYMMQGGKDPWILCKEEEQGPKYGLYTRDGLMGPCGDTVEEVQRVGILHDLQGDEISVPDSAVDQVHKVFQVRHRTATNKKFRVHLFASTCTSAESVVRCSCGLPTNVGLACEHVMACNSKMGNHPYQVQQQAYHWRKSSVDQCTGASCVEDQKQSAVLPPEPEPEPEPTSSSIINLNEYVPEVTSKSHFATCLARSQRIINLSNTNIAKRRLAMWWISFGAYLSRHIIIIISLFYTERYFVLSGEKLMQNASSFLGEDDGQMDLIEVKRFVDNAPSVKDPIAIYGNHSTNKEDSAGKAASQGSKKVMSCSVCKIYRPHKAAGHIKTNVNCPSRNDAAVLNGQTTVRLENDAVPRSSARAPMGPSGRMATRGKNSVAAKYVKWQSKILEDKRIKEVCVTVFKERLSVHEKRSNKEGRIQTNLYKTLIKHFEETDATKLNCKTYQGLVVIPGIGPNIAKRLIDALRGEESRTNNKRQAEAIPECGEQIRKKPRSEQI